MDLQTEIPISNGVKTLGSWLLIFMLSVVGGPVSFFTDWFGYGKVSEAIAQYIPRFSFWLDPISCLPYLLVVGTLWWLFSKNSYKVKIAQLLLLIIVTSLSTALSIYSFLLLALR